METRFLSITRIFIIILILILHLASCGGGGGGDGNPSSGGGSTPSDSKATLELSPNVGSYQVGDSLKVDIFVNTDGRNVAVVGARVKYDPTNFQVNSIDTSESVFTMELEKEIDLTNGLIKITRGIPAPGINTNGGKVARINLTALSPISPGADNITFVFTPGSTRQSNVIMDDGLGTAILSVVYNAKITVS
jgi:hypothetical protein